MAPLWYLAALPTMPRTIQPRQFPSHPHNARQKKEPSCIQFAHARGLRNSKPWLWTRQGPEWGQRRLLKDRYLGPCAQGPLTAAASGDRGWGGAQPFLGSSSSCDLVCYSFWGFLIAPFISPPLPSCPPLILSLSVFAFHSHLYRHCMLLCKEILAKITVFFTYLAQ